MSKEAQDRQQSPLGWIRGQLRADSALWVVFLALLIISVFVSYSSLAYKGSSATYAKLFDQIRNIGVGFFFFIGSYLLYGKYRSWAKPFFWVSVGLTVLMLLVGNRVEGTTVRRSLSIPIVGGTFQPFEFLKIAVILMTSDALARRNKVIDSQPIIPWFGMGRDRCLRILLNDTIPVFYPCAVACLLTMFTSNSTTIIIGASFLALLFVGRVRMADFLKIAAVVAVLYMGYSLADGIGRSDTGASRLSHYAPMAVFERHADSQTGLYDNPDELLQTTHAKMAIASGRITGRGPGMSTHRSILEEASSDFAYAFILEEYGLIGGLIVLLCFTMLMFRSVRIFEKCGTAFPSMVVLGLGMTLTLQAFLHMGVSVSLMPLTGQQLPLVSNGGTSLIVCMAAMGMMLRISHEAEESEIRQNRTETLYAENGKSQNNS